MAGYNEFFTQADPDFEVNIQHGDSNIAEKDDFFKTAITKNIIRSYGGNDELVVKNVDLIHNKSQYLTIIGSAKLTMQNYKF